MSNGCNTCIDLKMLRLIIFIMKCTELTELVYNTWLYCGVKFVPPPPQPPTIQTSVKLCDFAVQYPCYFPTDHYQTQDLS